MDVKRRREYPEFLVGYTGLDLGKGTSMKADVRPISRYLDFEKSIYLIRIVC